MARTKRASKTSKYARAVPGNVMTVTLPIEDIIHTTDGTGAPASDLGNVAYDWKAVSYEELLRKFPLFSYDNKDTPLPLAFKICSIGVASGWGYNNHDNAYLTDANRPKQLAPVGAAVMLANGQLFEQSPESSRIMKVKPSSVTTFYGRVTQNANLALGAWCSLNGWGFESTSRSTAFSYKGELKYVTIAFRVPDGTDLPDDLYY